MSHGFLRGRQEEAELTEVRPDPGGDAHDSGLATGDLALSSHHPSTLVPDLRMGMSWGDCTFLLPPPLLSPWGLLPLSFVIETTLPWQQATQMLPPPPGPANNCPFLKDSLTSVAAGRSQR